MFDSGANITRVAQTMNIDTLIANQKNRKTMLDSVFAIRQKCHLATKPVLETTSVSGDNVAYWGARDLIPLAPGAGWLT